MEEKKLICVLCGQEWGVQNPFTNRCENEKCTGFCTWGYKQMKPESFFIDDKCIHGWEKSDYCAENNMCEKCKTAGNDR